MKDLPPLQWLRVFESSARHLSFTQAAQELNITQSAVSQQIKLLENFVGTSLFIRGPRSLQLTPTGKNYLPDIQQAIHILRTSTRANFVRSEQRRITIRSNWSFSVLWLTPRLHSFTRQHPEISLNIVPVMWDADFDSRTDSIEIRFGPAQDQDGMQLTRDMTCFPLCSPRLAEQIRQPADLLEHGRINSLGVTTPWDKMYRALDLPGPGQAMQVELTTQAYMLAIEMTRNDLGVMLGVSFLTVELIARGELVPLFEAAIDIPVVIYLKAEPGRLSDSEKLFCDWLLSELEPQ